MRPGALSGVLAHAAGAAAWAALCRRLYAVDRRADEVHHVETGDGWRLALSRWHAAAGAPRRRLPVLLCPGLSANRHAFDLAPEVSLARHLAERGFDTWCLELRGHGLSEAPGPLGPRRYGWDFDAHVEEDAPAALRGVLDATGAPRVLWVGHSMGGILLYALLARGAREVRAGVTIGSALDYSGTPSDFHAAIRALAVARAVPAVPLGPLALVTAPLAGRRPNRLEEFNLWPANVAPELVRRLNASTFHPVSSPVLVQLATAFEPGGLRARDGRTRYLDGLAAVDTPVLALAGSHDRQCAPAAARRTVEALGGARRLIVHGPDGDRPTAYGHFDLLIGREAPREVWPELVHWLAAHDA